MKVRNAIVSAVFCLLLLSPCALWLIQDGLKAPLPGWLTADNASYLSGGISKSKIHKYLSLKGFRSEKFQSALEIEVENHIPLKADVLLTNALLQRSAIAASNTLFRFASYPTFFGSATVYLPHNDALAFFPETSKKLIAKATETAEGIAEIAQAYPEKNFYLVVSDMSDTSASNPASLLVSNATTSEDYLRALQTAIEGIENVHVISDPFQDPDEYYQYYYHADHHWNGFGTLKIYDQIAQTANLPYRVTTAPQNINFDGFLINGSFARDGLMLINEPALEPQLDLSGFQVQNDELAPIAMGPNGVQNMIDRGLMADFNFYTQWYGSSLLTAQSPIENTESATDKQAVVIMDSYADSLHWVLARNYQYLQCFRDIRAGAKGEESLLDRINEAGADDVYFVGSAVAYARIPDNFPNYFKQ